MKKYTIVKTEDLKYVECVLDVLNMIGRELKFREPYISNRIKSHTTSGKNKLKEYFRHGI